MEAVAQPVAAGDVTQTPVAHLLIYLQDRQKSGVLEVTGPDGTTSEIMLKRGRPVAARFGAKASGIEAGLLPLCGYAGGTYAFYGDRKLVGGAGVLEGVVDPYALVARSMEGFARDDVVDALLSRYGDHAMRLQPGRPIDRLRLGPEGQRLLELLRASPDTVECLVRAAPLPPAQARRLLYLLVITKMVAPYDGQVRVTDRGTSQAKVRPGTAEGTAGQAQRQDRRASVPTRPHTPAEPVSAARSLASMRATRNRMRQSGFAPSARPPSHPVLEFHGADEGPDAKRRRAESRLRNGQPSDAVEILQELVEQGPPQARIHGLLAWALFEQFRALGGAGELPAALIEAVKRAHELDPDEAFATFARGLVFKHAGKDKKALVCFKRASAKAPTLVEAKREARLLTMRQRGA